MVDATTREAMVLNLLAEAGGACLPGEVLSSKLGLSPADVFRQIDRLRAKGYRIDALGSRGAHRGYRLVSIPDRLTPLEVSPFLTTHDIGRTLHHFETVGSTNEVARQLAEEGAFHGETVVAEAQTQGRGRRGRSWFSPHGKNVYLSVVLRPPVPAARAAELNLVAAVSVAQAVREAFDLEARIKWPNDVLLGERKLAGILTEAETRGQTLDFAILGIGVNVNLDAAEIPEALRPRATSLQIALGQPVDRPLFTAALLSRLESWYDAWVESGFGEVRAAWSAASSTLGQRVRVEVGEGRAARIVEGVAEAIDDGGALMVRAVDGTRHRVVAGEVQHLRPTDR